MNKIKSIAVFVLVAGSIVSAFGQAHYRQGHNSRYAQYVPGQVVYDGPTYRDYSNMHQESRHYPQHERDGHVVAPHSGHVWVRNDGFPGYTSYPSYPTYPSYRWPSYKIGGGFK
jgi:hypothetical protein